MDDHPGGEPAGNGDAGSGARDPDDLDAELEGDLVAREAARVRRRDRELAAERNELMRPGMGKVFKQIQESWGRQARESKARGGSRRR